MDQVRGLVNFFSGSGKNDGITARPVYRGTGAPESSRDRTLSIHGGVGGGIDWPPVSLERSESIVINRGLRNRPGENNCFLNAAVQVRNSKILYSSILLGYYSILLVYSSILFFVSGFVACRRF